MMYNHNYGVRRQSELNIPFETKLQTVKEPRIKGPFDTHTSLQGEAGE